MNKYSVSKLPSDVLLEIASRHRTLRKRLKLSQMELAKRSGVSFGSLKRFERTGQISLESLLKLAHLQERLSDFDAIFKSLENFDDIEKLFSDKTRGK